MPRTPLIVVSNRLPVTVKRTRGRTDRVRSSGGLVSAFEPLLERRGGLWIGWPGTELKQGETLSDPDDSYEIVPVHVPRGDVRGYYNGFSNRTLWPVFHSLPSEAHFREREWEAYERVNQRFADAVAQHAPEGASVIVNDYHLTLLPALLAAQGRRDIAVGYFLHIPFPPYDVFRVLPWARRLLRGMLGADLVGFHTQNYVQNFLECSARLVGAEVQQGRGLVTVESRTTRVVSLPLGIDFQRYESLAMSVPKKDEPSERVVLGVDRLDYTKGIPERLHAFARLLENHPEQRGEVAMVQLAVPSRSEVREYRDLKREIDELVGRINGRFATETWTPIRYLYRSVSPERLAAMYRDADVGFVTPLRDGLNLVAKEFVACQVANPGVLVLSHMAGSAETMREALRVNPYNIEDTADKLHRALTMPRAERAHRMERLRRREKRRDVHAWANQLLRRLTTAIASNQR
ncbi:MAG: trehalose-6-phosphate synthase [Gemmatimonadales bacterium]|jgi:trehalose 6-phosphate synthase/phosphatase